MTRKPVVVVTGVSKGIGLAVTRFLLTELGAIVVGVSRSRTPELEQLEQAHSSAGDLLLFQCDVTDAPAINAAISTTLAKYAHIDALVLNAAMLEPAGKIAPSTPTSTDAVPLDAWHHHFEVNFFSLITALHATLPALRASELGGRVVFVSSGAAVGAMSGWAPYNASKAAMNSLCRTLAQEEPTIPCVAVRPGRVDTAMQVVLREGGKAFMNAEEYEARKTSKIVQPEEPGYVIAALALRAPLSLSGQFVSWDSEELREYRKA